MKNGEIIADGPPKQVINPKIMAKIYDFNIILKRHPKEGYKYILPDMVMEGSGELTHNRDEKDNDNEVNKLR